ncbi:hypothetical protein H2248_007552 [Termitomyces sp. 'cryptogamus']|nr:hypothetical protein H2248_007552 [Termitomyces sp. 'cryptogamus']
MENIANGDKDGDDQPYTHHNPRMCPLRYTDSNTVHQESIHSSTPTKSKSKMRRLDAHVPRLKHKYSKTTTSSIRPVNVQPIPSHTSHIHHFQGVRVCVCVCAVSCQGPVSTMTLVG